METWLKTVTARLDYLKRHRATFEKVITVDNFLQSMAYHTALGPAAIGVLAKTRSITGSSCDERSLDDWITVMRDAPDAVQMEVNAVRTPVGMNPRKRSEAVVVQAYYSSSTPAVGGTNTTTSRADKLKRVKCFKCQKFGHYKRHCPELANSKKQQSKTSVATVQSRVCTVVKSSKDGTNHHLEEAEAQMRVASGLGRTLRRAKATAEISGTATTIAIYFDPGSTANFLSSRVFQPGIEKPLAVNHHGGKSLISRAGFGYFTGAGEVFKVYGWLSNNVPAGCDVLLGDHAIRELGLLEPESTEHTGPIDALPELRLVGQTQESVQTSVALDNGGSTGLVGPNGMCFWSEASMREYLDSHSTCFPEKTYDWTQVEVSPELPKRLRKAVKRILKKCAKVFKADTVPPVNHVYLDHHGPVNARQYLREGHKPFHCKPPRWAEAKARFLNEFMKHALKFKIIRPCPDSPWAMRVTVVSKGDGSPRLCLDLRPLNAAMKPVKYRISNGMEMLLKISVVMVARIDADVMGSYWQYVLGLNSQELFCFWLPVEIAPGVFEARKFAFCVLPFGWSLSPFILAQHMEAVLQKMKPETRKFMANFYDDFSGGVADGPDWDRKFLEMVDDFFTVLMQEGVVLKSTKCRVGSPTATFYGFDIARDGSNGLGQKFLSGLDKVVAPTSPSEVRSLMGTLNVARDYVPRFSELAAPIQALVRKDVPFAWTQECDDAVEKILVILRSGVRHYKPVDDLPLYLATDASDVGAGGHLYQLVPAVGAGDKAVRRTIAFFSKTWTATMRRRPVFYREAWAMLHFLSKSRLFAMSNHHPVKVQTDHVTLQWIKKNDKGAVTSFLLDELADMRFTITYHKGKSTVISVPDSLSRYPMVGPRTWAWGGLEAFYQLLRRTHSSSLLGVKRIWIYAGTDTVKLKPLVRMDVPGASIVEQSPTVGRFPRSVEFAILAPPVDRAPEICAELLRVRQPGAVLVPTDLVGRIVEQAEAGSRKAVEAALEQSSFVGSAGSMFLWVVCNCGTKCDVIVASALATTGRSILDPKDWIEATDFPQSSALKDGSVAIDDNRVRWYHPNNKQKMRKLLVPNSMTKNVVRVVHEESVGHLGVRPTLHEVKERFFWPGMRKTVVDTVVRCEDCNHIKGSRVLAHGRFRGARYFGPRVMYAIDIKKAAPDGSSILAAVDVFDGYTILMPIRRRSQGHIVDTLVDEVFLLYGFPATIRTDHAAEFGPSFTALMKSWGIEHTTTKGYHGQGNAHVERMWTVLKALFRGTKTMVDWRRQLRMIAFAINTGLKEALGMSPFEVQFGLPAISALHAGTVTSDEVDDGLPSMRELETLQDLFRANVQRTRDTGNYNRQKQADKLNDGKTKSVEFKLGQLVMAWREPKGIHTKYYSKLKDFVPKWIGPFKVIGRTGDSYELEACTDGATMSKGQIFEHTVMNLTAYKGEAVEGADSPAGVLDTRFREVHFTVPLEWIKGSEVELTMPGAANTVFLRVPAWAKIGDVVSAKWDTLTGAVTFQGRKDTRVKKKRRRK